MVPPSVQLFEEKKKLSVRCKKGERDRGTKVKKSILSPGESVKDQDRDVGEGGFLLT